MYIVYKTTNLENGKFYIGVHRTDNASKSKYLGSGKLLKQAIEKYGESQFQRETLFEFDSAEEAFNKEQELLTEELLRSTECYNLKKGGNGGWKFVHDNGLTNKNKTRDHYVLMAKRRAELNTDPVFKQRWLASLNNGPVSKETKKKISESLSGRVRNRMWITNEKENRFHDTNLPIEEGFRRGRV